jgi:hypothetical protein
LTRLAVPLAVAATAAQLCIPSAMAQTTTREAFAASANQICLETSQEGQARARRATGRTVIDPAKPRSSAKIIEVTVPVARAGIERIGALPRPPGDEAAIQLFVDGSLRGFQMLKKVAKVLRAKNFDLKDQFRYSKLINRAAKQIEDALANVEPLGVRCP